MDRLTTSLAAGRDLFERATSAQRRRLIDVRGTQVHRGQPFRVEVIEVVRTPADIERARRARLTREEREREDGVPLPDDGPEAA